MHVFRVMQVVFMPPVKTSASGFIASGSNYWASQSREQFRWSENFPPSDTVFWSKTLNHWSLEVIGDFRCFHTYLVWCRSLRWFLGPILVLPPTPTAVPKIGVFTP